MAVRMTVTEHGEQSCLMDWVERKLHIYPSLRWLFAIPNGGKRDKAVAAALREEGVKAGVPDLCLPVPRGEYHGLFIELKVGNNQPTPEQREWIAALREAGYRVEVCWGMEAARDVLIEYLEG